jgi:small subunit ribosomal protein S9
MALSLTTAFSHLSLPSTSKFHPLPLLHLRFPSSSSSRRAARLALAASAAEAAEPVEVEEAPAEDGADEVVAVEDELSGPALRKYVKQRLPGGFAAQRITATGRRKTAIARVVLQEGTGRVFINFRDAKVCARALRAYFPIRLEKCALANLVKPSQRHYLGLGDVACRL